MNLMIVLIDVSLTICIRPFRSRVGCRLDFIRLRAEPYVVTITFFLLYIIVSNLVHL